MLMIALGIIPEDTGGDPVPSPSGEPISLELAKAHLRIVEDTSEDSLILAYIKAAREWVENYTGLVLVQRAFTEQRDSFGRFIELYRYPIVPNSVSISYTDTSGTPQVYENALYSVDRRPARIYPALSGSWPSVGSYGSVSISYTAGLAEGSVPQALIQAMLLLVGHWYSSREAVSDRAAEEVPFAVNALCQQYRMPVL